MPLASSANYAASGVVTPNSAVVPVNRQTELCIFTSSAVDLVVDVTGYVERR